MTRILLIEDDEIMRENTSEILELAQFEVFSAPDGRQGCRMAKEIVPDLIISDIMMPNLDGYGVLNILSKDPKTASIPFIFLTAKAEKSEIRKGMELGADDYLTKPFDEADLLSAIDIRLKKYNAVNKAFSESFETYLDTSKNSDFFKELFEGQTEKTFDKKQLIYDEGDDPLFLYYVNSGKIKICKSNEEGKEYVTSVIQKGEFFGLTRLFEGTPYTDSAVAMDKSEIIKLPRESFFNIIHQNRDIAVQFIKILSGNVESKEEQLLSLAYDTVRKRTASVLARLATEDNTSLKITRDDLASMVGTATETVIRCLSDLKADKLIEVKGREIKVLDVGGLKQLPY